jgi:colanic acid biosynthesis glycosyl transferase WcaI
MASGRPIIGCLDEGSDSYNLILRSGGGICIPPEDPNKLAEVIIKLKADKKMREAMGRKGRDYIEKFHSPKYAADRYEYIIEKLVKNKY